jgi:retron-type reverse transcriptase
VTAQRAQSTPQEKVRVLQRKLYRVAKAQPARTFGVVYDKVCSQEVLDVAWNQVKRNRGAAGVDGETIEAIEAQGVEQFLTALREDLTAQRYRPMPVRRVFIPKPDGRQRPLGIPRIRDRVVQAAVRLVIEPLFEASFRPGSYGFRPKRGARQAAYDIRKWVTYGYDKVIDLDLKSYFDTIDQTLLMKLVARRVRDPRVLRLIRRWLRAGVMHEGTVEATVVGTPQGGVISPLLANIYLHPLDVYWEREVKATKMVRYADDRARPKPLLLRDERSPHHEYPKSVSSLGPGATGQPVPSKQDRHNVLEGSATCGVVRSPGTETNLQAAIAMNDRCAPVSVYPAVIAARAGTGVAEPPVVGRRLLSMVDELGMRNHRDSRGEGGSMQGLSRGVRLETPPGSPMLAVETEDIRPEAEIPMNAWLGSRRGSYERRRRVMPPEQRAPTSVMLLREGRTA